MCVRKLPRAVFGECRFYQEQVALTLSHPHGKHFNLLQLQEMARTSGHSIGGTASFHRKKTSIISGHDDDYTFIKLQSSH